jgi:MYXO-CTERM domain-containing protein
MMLSVLALVPLSLAAEVGSLSSSTWYEVIEAPTGETVWFQIHYPSRSTDYGADADPTAGPYPLVAFMHGHLGQAWMYQSLCDAIASMGFVVVNLDTETGPWLDPEVLAQDAQTALEWVDARSAEPDHWLAGMASDAPWSAMGHSMGGIAMAHLIDQEPRINLAVGFAPYRDEAYVWDAYTTFHGAALMIGGSEDETSTPEIVSGWLRDVDAPTRGLYISVHGAGHQAVTDIELEAAELTDAEQLAASIELASNFVNAEHNGEEQAYDRLICTPTFTFDTIQSRGTLPATAAVAVDPAHLRLSVVGAVGDTVILYGSAGPGTHDTPDGPLGLHAAVELARLDLPEGAACVEIALPAELEARAWIQAQHIQPTGAVNGRVIDVFETGATAPEPDEDTGTNADTGPTEDNDSAAPAEPQDTSDPDPAAPLAADPQGEASAKGGVGCGCSATPSPLSPLSALLALALLLRRRP